MGDEERTAGAARCRPAIDRRGEHEVVNDELRAPFEQIEQISLAVRSLEHIVLVDPDHRQPAALRGQRVSRAGSCFFLHEQLLASGIPFSRRHDSRNHFAILSFHFFLLFVKGSSLD
jgi:hypothetical protein